MANSISRCVYFGCALGQRRDVMSRTALLTQTVFWLLFALLICCGDVFLHAQTPGFYSIDCGSTSTETYSDYTTTIIWTPDLDIMPDGIAATVTAPTTGEGDAYTTLRYFPGNHSKYCYPLAPVEAGSSYIVRAGFWMGDRSLYATEVVDQISFQLIIDAYVVTLVNLSLPQARVKYSEVYVTANASRMAACVARTTGSAASDPPFISSLELRPLPRTTYGGMLVQTLKYPMLMVGRSNYGAPSDYPRVLRSTTISLCV
ncbi:hypothetical protein GOP47_0023287, partial [Adiantum capillus-veneris]